MKLKGVDLDFLKQGAPKIGPTGIAIFAFLRVANCFEMGSSV